MENKTLPKCTFLLLVQAALCALCFLGALKGWNTHASMWGCFFCAYGTLSFACLALVNLWNCFALLNEKPAAKKSPVHEIHIKL